MAAISEPDASGIIKVSGAGRIQRKDLPIFSRLMAAMLDAGMPIVQVLDALESETADPTFRTVLGGIKTRIESGESISQAMAHYPQIFDSMYISMMQAGEASGQLSDICARVGEYLEASAKLRRKVMSALMYPSMVGVIAVVLVIVMLVWLIPGFDKIYKDLGGGGAKLPLATEILVRVSEVFRHWFLLIAGLFVGGIVAFVQFARSPGGALKVDTWKIHAPVFGSLIRKVAIARFASTFSQLMKSGVPMLRALEIVSAAVANRRLGHALEMAKVRVERGDALSEALSDHKDYPRMLIQMLVAGERSGKVDEMMSSIAKLYEDEVDSAVSGLTSLIEPLMMVFLGVVVGGIMIAMFMPIFKLTSVLGA
ncbi:MAG: type II secretion system F family protein [Kiritimatiellia bacterium]